MVFKAVMLGINSSNARRGLLADLGFWPKQGVTLRAEINNSLLMPLVIDVHQEQKG